MHRLEQGQDAVVFTSAGVIATVCAQLLRTAAAGLVALHRVAVDGAVTELAVGRSGWTPLTVNEHTNLGGQHSHIGEGSAAAVRP